MPQKTISRSTLVSALQEALSGLEFFPESERNFWLRNASNLNDSELRTLSMALEAAKTRINNFSRKYRKEQGSIDQKFHEKIKNFSEVKKKRISLHCKIGI